MRFKPYTNPKKLLLNSGYEKNGARGYVRPIRFLNNGKVADRYHSIIDLDGFIEIHIDIQHNKLSPKKKMTKKFSKGCVTEMDTLKNYDYSLLPTHRKIFIKLKKYLWK